MHKIEETIIEEKIELEPADPYAVAMSILTFVSEQGKVIENENDFRTDGPRQGININFDLVEEIDKDTVAKMNFDFSGETGHNEKHLSLKITGEIKGSVNVTTETPAGMAFAEYYEKNIYPKLREKAKKKFGLVLKEVKKKLKEAKTRQ